jgi:hypothetical protein
MGATIPFPEAEYAVKRFLKRGHNPADFSSIANGRAEIKPCSRGKWRTLNKTFKILKINVFMLNLPQTVLTAHGRGW